MYNGKAWSSGVAALEIITKHLTTLFFATVRINLKIKHNKMSAEVITICYQYKLFFFEHKHYVFWNDKIVKQIQKYSDEEYENVMLWEIGDDIDEDETSDATEQSENGEDDGEGDNDSDDDNDYGNEEDDDDDGGDGDGHHGNSNDNYSYSEDVQISDILITTKYGRTCRTWRERYLNY